MSTEERSGHESITRERTGNSLALSRQESQKLGDGHALRPQGPRLCTVLKIFRQRMSDVTCRVIGD